MKRSAKVAVSDFELAPNNAPDCILTNITNSPLIVQDKGKFVLVVWFRVKILTRNTTHDARLVAIFGCLAKVIVVDELPKVRQRNGPIIFRCIVAEDRKKQRKSKQTD